MYVSGTSQKKLYLGLQISCMNLPSAEQAEDEKNCHHAFRELLSLSKACKCIYHLLMCMRARPWNKSHTEKITIDHRLTGIKTCAMMMESRKNSNRAKRESRIADMKLLSGFRMVFSYVSAAFSAGAERGGEG